MAACTRRDGIRWTSEDGAVLRRIRKSAAVSLRHVAGAAGVSIAYAWDCERGNRAPNANLIVIYRGIAAAKERTC